MRQDSRPSLGCLLAVLAGAVGLAQSLAAQVPEATPTPRPPAPKPPAFAMVEGSATTRSSGSGFLLQTQGRLPAGFGVGRLRAENYFRETACARADRRPRSRRT